MFCFRQFVWCLSLVLMAATLLPSSGFGEEQTVPKVVVSIPPLHGLAGAVMAGVGKPELLVSGAASPHTMQLKPSQIGQLSEADLVLWIGPGLESFLASKIAPLGLETRSVALMTLPGLTLLPRRFEGIWADNGADNGDDHDLDHGHGHGHGDESESSIDPHIWLSPDNARAMARFIAGKLAGLDPVNADHYAANAERLDQAIDALDRRISERLAPVSRRPVIVFHDAFQYLFAEYDLTALGAVMPRPHQQPGARHLSSLRRVIERHKVRCAFGEPQFTESLGRRLISDQGVYWSQLDPLGRAEGPDGGNAYLALMQRNADSLIECLSN